jgi:hypothetical protein
MRVPWPGRRFLVASSGGEPPSLFARLGGDYPELPARVVREVLERARRSTDGLGGAAADVEDAVAVLARQCLDLARDRHRAAAQRVAIPGRGGGVGMAGLAGEHPGRDEPLPVG